MSGQGALSTKWNPDPAYGRTKVHKGLIDLPRRTPWQFDKRSRYFPERFQLVALFRGIHQMEKTAIDPADIRIENWFPFAESNR